MWKCVAIVAVSIVILALWVVRQMDVRGENAEYVGISKDGVQKS